MLQIIFHGILSILILAVTLHLYCNQFFQGKDISKDWKIIVATGFLFSFFSACEMVRHIYLWNTSIQTI